MVYRDESSGESREISPSTPSSSESISPFSGISNKRKILMKPLLNCAICGGKTKCRHFGAVSCTLVRHFFVEQLLKNENIHACKKRIVYCYQI
uniref:Nuclear receptor domain-containing protein n=1 Tax=Panagrolaimus superbus TaxID=310955 RepID=A0A914Y6C7_9BILA